MQHGFVRHSPRDALHQLRVGNRVEVLREVRIDHLGASLLQLLMDLLHRIDGAAPGPIPVRRIAEVGFEDGLQDELRRRLGHAVFERGNPQRPLAPSRLRYHHPPHGLRPIPPVLQLALQLLKPTLLAVLRKLLERLPIHSRSALVPLRLPERLRQNVPSIELVVQAVEPERRLRLGLRVQLRTELFELCLGCQAHANLPLRPFLAKHPEPGLLPSTVITRFLGTTSPSDSWLSPRPHDVFGSHSHAGQVSRVAHLALLARRALPPRWSARRSSSRPSRRAHGLPRMCVRSASTIALSGPARASLALRPTGSLDLLSEAFCLWASSPPVTRRPRQIATEGDDLLLGRDFHPLVRCTFTAHAHWGHMRPTRGNPLTDASGPSSPVSQGSREARGRLTVRKASSCRGRAACASMRCRRPRKVRWSGC
jgi:hypothetical protein